MHYLPEGSSESRRDSRGEPGFPAIFIVLYLYMNNYCDPSLCFTSFNPPPCCAKLFNTMDFIKPSNTITNHKTLQLVVSGKGNKGNKGNKGSREPRYKVPPLRPLLKIFLLARI